MPYLDELRIITLPGDAQIVRMMEGELEGDLDIVDAVTIAGKVLGSVTVHQGAELRITGEINGDVVVKRGGSLILIGRIKGAIVNEGGAVDIFGFVGRVELAEGTNAYVSRGAIVGGERASRVGKLSPS